MHTRPAQRRSMAKWEGSWSLTSVEPEHEWLGGRVADGLSEPVEERAAAVPVHRHVPRVLRERHRRLPRQRLHAVASARPAAVALALLHASSSNSGASTYCTSRQQQQQHAGDDDRRPSTPPRRRRHCADDELED